VLYLSMVHSILLVTQGISKHYFSSGWSQEIATSNNISLQLIKMPSTALPQYGTALLLPVVSESRRFRRLLLRPEIQSTFSCVRMKPIANKEQLPLVLQFVDSSGTLREEFIKFTLCDTGTAGSAIAENILDTL